MDIDLVSIIAPKVESYKSTLINFAKSRFLVAAQEFGMNEKETKALNDIADSIEVNVSSNVSSISFEITYGENHYLNIIQNGMPAPLTGGNGGVAMNPDGSTYLSEVPVQLQGNPIDSFAKEGKDVIEEIKTMAESVGRDIVEDAISDSKEEISVAVKAYLIPIIKNSIGGVS